MLHDGIHRGVHKSHRGGPPSLQLCNDFWKLNMFLEFDSYPKLWVDELVEWLGRALFIHTLGVMKGYWQILLAPSAQSKRAFSTAMGHWKYPGSPLQTPMSAATFQQLMEITLHPLVPMLPATWMTLSSTCPSGSYTFITYTVSLTNSAFTSVEKPGLQAPLPGTDRCLQDWPRVRFLPGIQWRRASHCVHPSVHLCLSLCQSLLLVILHNAYCHM